MVKLRVRRLYTDKTINPWLRPTDGYKALDKKKMDSACGSVIDVFKSYGLSFLDGFTNRKEKVRDQYFMDDREFGVGLMQDWFSKYFHKKFGDETPYLFVTPVNVGLFTRKDGSYHHRPADGWGDAMLAIIRAESTMYEPHLMGADVLVMHELGHAIYGLKHDHGENPFNRKIACSMNLMLDTPASLCEDCQTEARKVDEELRGK
jgi:hypothetical protein